MDVANKASVTPAQLGAGINADRQFTFKQTGTAAK